MEHSFDIRSKFNFSDDVYELFANAQEEVLPYFKKIDEIELFNQAKVLKAFQNNSVCDTHFSETTGYGYDDIGREVLDRVFAEALGAEDAIVRHSIISGTHALSLCLFGVLRPGDELLCVTGKPYDTLEEVIGIRGSGNGSLKEFGVNFTQVGLLCDGMPHYKEIFEKVNPKTKVVLIQKSKGYHFRNSLDLELIKKIIDTVKSKNKDTICIVDNCYGEFVESYEPTAVGADIIAGSLIKNPGGGLALTGGYIAGKKEYVKLVSYRLTTPGIGRKCGASLGFNRMMFQGLFLSPSVVANSVKTAILCSKVFEELGYEVSPTPSQERACIIQAIKLGSREAVISFCQGIQKGAPVDSFATPEPSDMPGYDNQVIMAAGTFVQGSTIELSADAPIKPPYIAYMQGGLTYSHGKLGLMTAVQEMKNKGIIIF